MSEDNVTSLFGRKPKKKEEKKEEEMSFAEIVKKNAETKERERLERIKANKGVIRSYRLLKK